MTALAGYFQSIGLSPEAIPSHRKTAIGPLFLLVVVVVSDIGGQIQSDQRETSLAAFGLFKSNNVLVTLGTGLQLKVLPEVVVVQMHLPIAIAVVVGAG